jgi:hypothetical protein
MLLSASAFLRIIIITVIANHKDPGLNLRASC